MNKSVIHNFDIVIKNDTKNSPEEFKRIFIKELAKVSKEMNLQKDIVQLWQEQKSFADPSDVNNNPAKKTKMISISEKDENVILRDETARTNFETNYSSISPFSKSDFFISSHNIKDSSIDYHASIIENLILENKSNIFNVDSTTTSQVYTGISTQENIIIPQNLRTIDNETYLEVTKTEIQKKFRNILVSNNTSVSNYKTTSNDNVEEQKHYVSQINFESQNRNFETTNETSINNINWGKLSELMIFKLSELSQEEKDIYLKEYYDKLISKISQSNLNIQQLFSEHDELFLLLKSIFPALPEKISIQTKAIVYPDLGVQKMYPAIGVENMFFKASGKLLDKTENKLEDYQTDATIKGKLTGSSNLLIFTMDEGYINEKKMNEASGNYDWIAVSKTEETEVQLKEAYGEKKGFIKNLIWRSHGTIGGAFLNGDLSKEPISDPSKNKSLSYIKGLLTNDANVVFTACSIVGDSLQPKREKYREGRDALSNFSNFFVGGSERSLFLNYTLSTAISHQGTRFIFNEGLHKEKRAGFLWITQNGIKSYFYNVQINSSGGINLQQLRSTWEFGSNKNVFNRF